MATKGGGRTRPAPRSEAEAAEAKRRMAGAGYFASRCKGGLPPTENSRPPPLPGRAVCCPDRPLRRPWARSSPTTRGSTTIRCDMRPAPQRTSCLRPGSCRQFHEASDVLGSDLHPQPGPQRIDAERPEILVEVPQPWRQGYRLDPGLARSADQARHRAISGRVVVTSNVEAAQHRGKQDGGEMRG